MPTTQSLDAKSITEFLTMLYGLNVSAKATGSVDASNVHAVATYSSDDGDVKGSIFCDLACAAKLGAALTQIPAGGVEDAIKEGALPDNILENLSEAFNILVNIFPDQASKRLALKEVICGKEAAEILNGRSSGESQDFELDIQRYGTGQILVISD